MSKNFKQAFSELTTKLSLKDKQQKVGNYTKIEKPLSRNVRFLDLSNTQPGKQANTSQKQVNPGDPSNNTTNINQQSNNTQN